MMHRDLPIQKRPNMGRKALYSLVHILAAASIAGCARSRHAVQRTAVPAVRYAHPSPSGPPGAAPPRASAPRRPPSVGCDPSGPLLSDFRPDERALVQTVGTASVHGVVETTEIADGYV